MKREARSRLKDEWLFFVGQMVIFIRPQRGLISKPRVKRSATLGYDELSFNPVRVYVFSVRVE